MIKSQSFRVPRSLAWDWTSFLKDVLLFVVFYIFLSSAQFGFACGYALFCTVCYFKAKKLKPFLFLNVSAFLILPAYHTIYSVLLPSGAMYLLFIVFEKSKRSLGPLKLCVAASCTRLMLLLGGGNNAVIAGYMVEIFISAVFVLVAVNAFKAPLFRGLKYKVSIDEMVCVAALVLAFFAGLYGIDIYGIKPFLTVAALTVLLSLYVYSLSFALTYSVIIGIAVCLLSSNPAFLGVFAVYAVCANIFKDTSKYLAAVSVVLIDLLFAYYFEIYDQYSYLNLISLAAGCFLFLSVRKKHLEKLSVMFGNKTERQLSRHIVNRTRAELNRKLLNVSEVFYEMERLFSGMIKGYMSPEDAVKVLSNDAMGEICDNCPDKAKCHKANAALVEKGYNKAISAGIDKGKVNLLDIPAEFASVCPRSNYLLPVCGRLASSYRQYAIVVSNLDTSRTLIGRQFKGVGEILSQLAKETKNSVGFDIKTEKTIVDELAYNNIVCAEAVVYNENGGETHISLLVKTGESYYKNISRIISGLTGEKMIIYSREESRREGFTACFT